MPNHDFLKRLLEAPGTSSFEALPARVWRDEAAKSADKVWSDAYGNSFASYGSGDGLRVMLAGHIDEIGLLITYIDDNGLLYFTGVGINDGSHITGQRVRVVGEQGQTVGVIGRKPPHLSGPEDRNKKIKLDELWIDIGATSKEEALQRATPGSFAVFEAPVLELSPKRWASKALDNRVGAYIALETAKAAAERGCEATVIAAATTQEEISGVGANVAAYQLEPDLAIALDLTHASDVPNVDKKLQGDISLGSGPVVEFGSTVHQGVARRLRDSAGKAGIPLQSGFSGRRTATDADDIAKIKGGAPTILLSIPNRYMHSPVEVVDLGDIEAAIDLLSRFLCELEGASDLLPQA